MIPPKIAPLPPAPVRADAPVDFSTKADAMVGALQPFADQANTLAVFVNNRADNANASATSVAGVQSAVSADRVLSQQAASNAAGSAAAALNSANTANSRATAAQNSANASEASAVRAEDAAQYVENIADGAAPVNNPNFTGVVRVNSVPIGTAATKDVGESSGDVMEVGAGGWLSTPRSYSNLADLPSGSYLFNGVGETDLGDLGTIVQTLRMQGSSPARFSLLQIGTGNPLSGRTSSLGYTPFNENGSGGFREIIHTGNIQSTTGQSTGYPMTQKAVTDAISARGFADASGVLTVTSGALSNDMSSFLSSMTFADMGGKIGQYENIQRNAAATGTVSINLASASEFDLTLTGNTTIVFGGSVVPAGKSRSFVVRIRQGATARTLTWPASVTWLVVGPITTPAANKICEYVFSYSAESGWFGRIGASN